MKACSYLLLLGSLVTSLYSVASGQDVELVTHPDLAQPPGASGSGDSVGGVISRDGRYVAFASTAANLVASTNHTAIPLPGPVPAMNVYLRDRTKGTTILVSANVSGTAGGNGDTVAVDISNDGRYVLFESRASDLTAGDTNNAADIFVRDTVNGTTALVSVSTSGNAGNGISRQPAMTPDGRYVAFVSSANNLVDRDTNGIPDIFVRDLHSGTTVLASVGGLRRGTATLAGSEAPVITPDGRYVAFYSAATNLVPGVPAGGDIYVRDLVSGTTAWASSGARGAWGVAANATNIANFNHCISDDGQFVAYESSQQLRTGPPLLGGLVLRWNVSSATTDLAHTNAALPVAAYEDARSLDLTRDGRFIAFVANTNGINRTNTCVCVWDEQTGSITLASAGLNGLVASNSVCAWPVFDASGAHVAFLSTAANLATNSPAAGYHVYVHDLQNGSTVLVDRPLSDVDSGESVDPATAPEISDDGRFVVFSSPSGNLLPGDLNHAEDVFCSDWKAGSLELVSCRDAALPAQTPDGFSVLGSGSISEDGGFVAFASDARNIAGTDTNGYRDIYVADLARGSNVLVSAGINSSGANGPSMEPAISPDGRFVTFSSLGTNLVPGDVNGFLDVFIRDLEAGTNALVSADLNNNGAGNAASYSPLVGRGGRYVLFRSRASNLAAGVSSTTYENIFVRDVAAGTNVAVTTSGSGVAAMTPDARYVIYAAGSLTAWQVYIWDVAAATRMFTNAPGTATGVQGVAISDDGRRAAYALSTSVMVNALYQVDLRTGTRTAVEPSVAAAYGNLRLSGNGRFLVATKAAGTPPISQVYLFDLEAGTNMLVSRTYDAELPANGRSDSAVISADGRFVAYRSAATNIVTGDTNAMADIFIFDLQSGSNTVVGAGAGSSMSGLNSAMPVFSGDGKTLFFQSLASNFAPNDFNRSGNIFALPFFYVALLPGNVPAQAPWLSWPWVSTRNYQVEYKDSPADATWQQLDGSFTNSGNKAWLQDRSPNPIQRVYRIRAF